MVDEQRSEEPPWNWTTYTEAELEAEMNELAVWVAGLQEAFGRWVRLPACWPCHRALREELSVFWYWRQRIETSEDASAEEAVRWHQSLRVSAEAWAEAFGGCQHESVGEVDEMRDARETLLAANSPFLEAAKSTLTKGPREATPDGTAPAVTS